MKPIVGKEGEGKCPPFFYFGRLLDNSKTFAYQFWAQPDTTGHGSRSPGTPETPSRGRTFPNKKPSQNRRERGIASQKSSSGIARGNHAAAKNTGAATGAVRTNPLPIPLTKQTLQFYSLPKGLSWGCRRL